MVCLWFWLRSGQSLRAGHGFLFVGVLYLDLVAVATCKARGRQLFATLTSWTQEMSEQNGVEFWSLFWKEMAPDNHSKSLIWRRSLLSPKLPSKETEFLAALQEWEADLDKYESEYGPGKAISDEDACSGFDTLP